MASIRYEAETQRQHPRHQIPMRAELNGQDYQVLDWSLGGFAVLNGSDFARGEKVAASLRIPFNGYDLGISVSAEARYASPEQDRTGFAFVDLDDRQASLLRYVADAVLAGEVVEAGEVLDVAGRSGTGRSRSVASAPPPTVLGRISNASRRLATGAAVFAIIGALGTFLWSNVYEELYVVRAQTASVAAKVVNLASPAVGRIGFVSEKKEVALGEPLLTVNPPVGDPIVVQSPCDCLQVDQRFSDGDFVKTGDMVLQLMRKDAPVIVSAIVPGDELMSLYSVRSGTIVYADGSRVNDAEILWLPGQGAGEGNLPRDPLTVVLDPRRTLSSSMVGQPVEVSFDLFAESLLGRAFDALSSAATASAMDETTAVDGGRVTRSNSRAE